MWRCILRWGLMGRGFEVGVKGGLLGKLNQDSWF